MPIDPMTLALIAGGALLLASKKSGKNGKKAGGEPPECPPGFVWDQAQRSCVPAEAGPAQLHITGDCESIAMLPDPHAYLGGYIQPAFERFLAAIQAQAKGVDDPVADGPQGDFNPHSMTVGILAQSPIAFATSEFPTLGALCALPTGPTDESAPPAILQLYNTILPIMDASIRSFNMTNEPTLVIPT